MGLRSLHQRSSRSDTLSPSPGAAFTPFIHITQFFFCFCFVFPSVFPLFFPGLFLRKFVLHDWGGKTRPVDSASGKSKNPVTAGVSFSRNEETWRDESVWCRPCATALGGNQIKGNLQISMYLCNCVGHGHISSPVSVIHNLKISLQHLPELTSSSLGETHETVTHRSLSETAILVRGTIQSSFIYKSHLIRSRLTKGS